MKRKIFLLSFVCLFLAAPGHAETRIITTDSHAQISPLLELSISQQGQSELKFGNILPSALETVEAGPVFIVIEVKSNSGERYQVTQAVGSDLSNTEGETISLQNLRFKTESKSGSPVMDLTPVSSSSQVIYTSDSLGRGDTISAQYVLTVPESQAPGDYSGLLTYTVSSL